MSDIYNCYNPAPTSSPQGQNTTASSSNSSTSTSPNTSPQPKATCPVALIANKNDLEHLRAVDKIEGISASMQYGCHFYELSVAENSPEVYQSFQTIITTLINQSHHSQPSKRKFSVSKMLGNLRLGRTSPSNSVPVATAPASIVDTNVITNTTAASSSSTCTSCVNSPAKRNSRESSPFSPAKGKSRHQRQGSSSSSDASTSSSSNSSNSTCNNLSSSICHLKSKLVELHSIKKRHNSPPICSL